MYQKSSLFISTNVLYTLYTLNIHRLKEALEQLHTTQSHKEFTPNTYTVKNMCVSFEGDEFLC